MLKSLENPQFLSKNFPFLYWRVYLFSWSDYFWLFDSTIARSSVFASLVGYLVYLNDEISKRFDFDFVTSNSPSVLGLDSKTKLICLYFGLMMIAFARMMFLMRRPHSIKQGPDLQSWVVYALNNFTYSDFLGLHQEIRRAGHRSGYGKYYDDDWDAFSDDANWAKGGRSDGLNDDEKRQSRSHVSYAGAKSRHEDLLRSILIDRYYEFSATRKISLFTALLLVIPGYILFLVPSLDLFLTIFRSLL